jgi:hypothetical protein
MANCFKCGQVIQSGMGLKKTVYTGASVGGFNISTNVVLNVVLNSFLSKGRVSVRSYYSQRLLCPACAAALDLQERRKLLGVAAIAIAVGVFIILVLVLSANTSRISPSGEGPGGRTNYSEIVSRRSAENVLSRPEIEGLRARLASLWNVQSSERPEELIVNVRVRLSPDRRLLATPEIVSQGTTLRYKAAADAALRALIQGQPYDMLRTASYEQWKDMIVTFDPRVPKETR